MTPRELAAHLSIEAEQLAAYGADDPVLRAAAQRLGLLAEAARTLQTGEHDVNVANMHMLPRNEAAASRFEEKNMNPAITKLVNAGWSMRKLAKELTARGHKISHVHLGSVLRKEKGTISADLREAIKAVTKVKV